MVETDEATARGFLFVGEALALDLVNTEAVVRRKPVDLLAAPNALPLWWRAAQARHPAAFAGEGEFGRCPPAAALPAALALRAALRRIVGAVADRGDGRAIETADLAILNRVVRTEYRAVAVQVAAAVEVAAAARMAAVLRPVVGRRGSGPSGALLPVARSAFDLLTANEPTRLHRCGNSRCVLFFYDTTKSGTRRWCSVGCMNRARSAARYRAKLAANAAPGGRRRTGDGPQPPSAER